MEYDLMINIVNGEKLDHRVKGFSCLVAAK